MARSIPHPSSLPKGEGIERSPSLDKQDEIEGLAILVRDLRKHKNVTLG